MCTRDAVEILRLSELAWVGVSMKAALNGHLESKYDRRRSLIRLVEPRLMHCLTAVQQIAAIY